MREPRPGVRQSSNEAAATGCVMLIGLVLVLILLAVCVWVWRVALG